MTVAVNRFLGRCAAERMFTCGGGRRGHDVCPGFAPTTSNSEVKREQHHPGLMRYLTSPVVVAVTSPVPLICIRASRDARARFEHF